MAMSHIGVFVSKLRRIRSKQTIKATLMKKGVKIVALNCASKGRGGRRERAPSRSSKRTKCASEPLKMKDQLVTPEMEFYKTSTPIVIVSTDMNDPFKTESSKSAWRTAYKCSNSLV
jgi:hypothetical protein